MTVCTPTIWLVGVTSGIWPRSLRTRGSSANTSSIRSTASISFSWLTRLESMPPGVWCSRTLMSMIDILVSSSRCLYLGMTSFSSTSLILASILMSKPVSRLVPSSVITSGSIAAWDVR